MNAKNSWCRIVPAIVTAVAFTLVPALFGQPNPERNPERNRDRNPERRPDAREFQRGDRPQPGGGAMGQALQAGRMAFQLERVLTEDQRFSLREAMEKQREKMRETEEKLRPLRKELLEAGLAEKFDEKAVRKLALEVGKLDAEITVLRAKAMSQIKPALSAEQMEKIKNPPPFEPGEFRRNFQGNPDNNRPNNRNDARPNRDRGPRDENDLPPKPKPEN